MIEWQNWNSELWLCHEREPTVVDDGHILRPPVYNPQVLGEEILLQGAVVPVESVREVFLVGIQVIQYHIRIRRSRGCEDYNFCEGRQLLKKLMTIRSHADACLS